MLVETLSSKVLNIPNFCCSTIEATKVSRWRPKRGLAVALHQKLIDNCVMVSKSNYSISFRLAHTPHVFIIAYLNPYTDVEEIIEDIANKLLHTKQPVKSHYWFILIAGTTRLTSRHHVYWNTYSMEI